MKALFQRRRVFRCGCWALAIGALGCTPFKNDAPGGASANEPDAVASGSEDASSPSNDDAAPPCDPTQMFGTPVPVPGLTDIMANAVAGLRLSRDYLTGYFYAEGRTDGVGNTNDDIFTATRASTAPDAPFTGVAPVLGSGINSLQNEADPSASGDGRVLVFSVFRPNDPESVDWATRVDPTTPFTGVEPVPGINDGGSTYNATPFLREDGRALYFASSRVPANQADIYRADAIDGGFSPPVAVPSVSTVFSEAYPVVTPDDLFIYYASDRTDGEGDFDIWEASRETTEAPFSAPVNVKELNTTAYEVPTFVTRDGCTLYLASTRGGTLMQYVATRLAR